MDIFVQCWDRSKTLGFTNVHDRRYFPSPQDITYILQQMKSEKR